MELYVNVTSSDICVVESGAIYDLPKCIDNIEMYEYYGYFNIDGITHKLFVNNILPDTCSVRITDISRENSSLLLIRTIKYIQMCDGPKKAQFLTEKDKLDFQLNEPYNLQNPYHLSAKLVILIRCLCWLL